MLIELEYENPISYNYVLSKANSPLIAEWAFNSLISKNINPNTIYQGFDLDQTDPYYVPTISVYRKYLKI